MSIVDLTHGDLGVGTVLLNGLGSAIDFAAKRINKWGPTEMVKNLEGKGVSALCSAVVDGHVVLKDEQIAVIRAFQTQLKVLGVANPSAFQDVKEIDSDIEKMLSVGREH